MNFLQLNQLPAVLKSTVYSRDLSNGEILFTQGDQAEAIFVLESGSILLLNYTEDGQQVNHYTVREKELFAELVLFKEVYLCTAIANRPSRVLVLPKQPFLEALKQSPELAEAFMAQLAERLHECKLLLELRSIRSAEKRVLHYLRLLAQSNETTVMLDRPFKDIAGDLGLTPEALSRALAHLQKVGEITRNQRRITFCKDPIRIDLSHGVSKR
jgi:CRP/FNR family transcriptional regulator, dissimilatory nitrate respiration regulator